MDENKTNQSVDGMRSGDITPPSAPAPSVDGFSTPSQPQRPVSAPTDSYNEADYATEKQLQEENSHESAAPSSHNDGGSSNKGLKLLLTLFVILFLAAAGAAGYLYTQKDSGTTVSKTTVDVNKYVQQNEALLYDNKTLQTQLTQAQQKAKNLTTTAQQLKTKCGNGCAAIVIPQ